MDFIPISDVATILTACTRIDISPGKPFVVNIAPGSETLLSFAQSEWCRLNASGRLLPAIFCRLTNRTLRR